MARSRRRAAQCAASAARVVGARRRGHSRLGRRRRRVVLESPSGDRADRCGSRRGCFARTRRKVHRGHSAGQHQPRHERRVLRGRHDVRSIERAQPDSGPAGRGTESIAHDRAASPIDVGKTLGVNMVLTGTVQRDKDRLRVTARLVNTADGFTIWSDMFERTSKDVFKVQDEISNAIVAAISPELSGGGSASAPAPATSSPAAPAANGAAQHGTSDLLAYDLYLRGKYFFDKRGETGLRRSLDYFQQATQRDSNFARAYAGIANAYALLPLYANVRVDSIMPLAMSAIDRAVRLDSTLAEAFASRATLLQAAWRWSEAERDYKRAITLDPNAAQPHQWYGELLLVLGRTAEVECNSRAPRNSTRWPRSRLARTRWRWPSRARLTLR